jgi:hypothetical protein
LVINKSQQQLRRTPSGRKKIEFVVYYEGIKRELKRRPTYECWFDERLKTKTQGSTQLTYTGLLGGLEHLKISTRKIDERFVSVMGQCVSLR